MNRRDLFVLAVLATACATKLKPLPQNPPRIIDSPPEDRAALNEAADLGLPAEERRWGVEDQKELNRQAAEKAEDKKRKIVVIPMPSPTHGGVSNDGGSSSDGGSER